MPALARGAVAALDDLVACHNDRARRLAYEILREPTRAQDVVADSFMAVVAAVKRS